MKRIADTTLIVVVAILIALAMIAIFTPTAGAAPKGSTVHVTVTDQYAQPFPAEDSVFVYLYKASWTTGKHYDEVRTGSPASFERVPSQDMLLLVMVYDNYVTPEGYHLPQKTLYATISGGQDYTVEILR